MTLGILFGKIACATLTAFAICYFNFRFRMLAFWLIFITLMLPLEVRIVPTYEVAGNALLPLQQLLDVLRITDLVAWLTGVEIALEWNLLVGSRTDVEPHNDRTDTPATIAIDALFFLSLHILPAPACSSAASRARSRVRTIHPADTRHCFRREPRQYPPASEPVGSLAGCSSPAYLDQTTFAAVSFRGDHVEDVGLLLATHRPRCRQRRP